MNKFIFGFIMEASSPRYKDEDSMWLPLPLILYLNLSTVGTAKERTLTKKHYRATTEMLVLKKSGKYYTNTNLKLLLYERSN